MKENKQAIKMLIQTLISEYNKNQDEFIDNMLKNEKCEFFGYAPARPPHLNSKVIEMHLKFCEQEKDIQEIFQKIYQEKAD